MGDKHSEEAASTPDSGSLSFLHQLSSSGLTIIGVLYLLGYVVVNGYQTKALHYNSSALQLKHLAAGALYAALTLFEVLIMASFIVFGITTWEGRREARKAEDKEQPDTKLKIGVTVRSFVWNWGETALVLFGVIGLVFGILGVASMPSQNILPAGQQYFLAWTGINLLISLGLAGGVMKVCGARFVPEQEQVVFATDDPSILKQLDSPDPSVKRGALKRLSIESGAQKMLIAPGLALIALLSLTSFQNVYGRLNPDYGGGALYRITLSLGPKGELPDSVRQDLLSPGCWLFLVDRDDKFVHLLRVDKFGKRLLQLEASEIAALEVLSTPPMHPDDALDALKRSSTSP
jgi:hypothetical protein